jgi:POT family proton-dependent oligopeptide transporter
MGSPNDPATNVSAATPSPAGPVGITREDAYSPGATDGSRFVRQPGILGYFRSHPIGFWFIFWGELAERCAYYGVRALFVVYMVNVLFPDSIPDYALRKGWSETVAYLFKAACYFTPLIGGLIADRYLGKYWTIVGFAVPYTIAPVLLGIPIPWVYYVALGILTIGTGVIKPNISTLMGMTYDQKRPGQTQLRSDAFFMFYFAINLGSTFSYAVLPEVSKHFGYPVAFAVPSVLMAVALAFFALGKKHYAVEVIQRRKASPEEKAERRQVLARIFGVFALIVLWFAVYDQNDVTWTLFIQDHVNLHFLGMDLQANQPHALNPILILVLVPVINLLFKWIDPSGRRFPATRKIMVGFLIMAVTAAVMSLAGFLTTSGDAKVSMWWIVLAFFLLTASEVLVSTVGLELAFTAAPNTMKSFVTACFLMTVFFGNLLNILVTKLYTEIGPGPFFALMAATMVGIAGAIIPVGRKFNREAAAAALAPATALPDGTPPDERITNQEERFRDGNPG